MIQMIPWKNDQLVSPYVVLSQKLGLRIFDRENINFVLNLAVSYTGFRSWRIGLKLKIPDPFTWKNDQLVSPFVVLSQELGWRKNEREIKNLSFHLSFLRLEMVSYPGIFDDGSKMYF